MNPVPKILIAGIGNIFFGDDAFGCEVARRLAARLGRKGFARSISGFAVSTWLMPCSKATMPRS